jgi:uncharacterized protein YggE
MKNVRIPLAVLSLSAVALVAGSAHAQFGQLYGEMASLQGAGRPALSAMGIATVRRKPTQLRLYMQLLAKGKTLEDALAKLKDREEAATAQLEAMKADKKSISFGTASVSAAQSARKKQIEQMIISQMRARGKKVPKGLQVPQTVTVAATLTAQWPIEEQANDKLLVLAHGIQEKIKTADLGGNKEAEKLSPEEEEFEEEANQAGNQFGNEDESQQGPQLLFVAALPRAEREKAMADAVVSARKQAAELAKAAGVALGPLVGLAGNCNGQMGDDDMPVRYGQYGGSEALRRIVARQTGEDPETKQDESLASDPTALRFTCTVTTLFQLGK